MCNIVLFVNIDISYDTKVKRISGKRNCNKGNVYHIDFNPSKKEGVCDV